MSERSLQDRYGPNGICFGCGPANRAGLRIKSFPAGDEVVMNFRPEPHHQAFEGAVNGGIIGTLFDCHGNWAAAYYLMRRCGAAEPPSTVTAEYHVKLARPTPFGRELSFRARAAELSDRKAVIEMVLEAGGAVCATCRGVFVSVPPGHPAYHRWS